MLVPVLSLNGSHQGWDTRTAVHCKHSKNTLYCCCSAVAACTEKPGWWNDDLTSQLSLLLRSRSAAMASKYWMTAPAPTSARVTAADHSRFLQACPPCTAVFSHQMSVGSGALRAMSASLLMYVCAQHHLTNGACNALGIHAY